MQDFFILLKFLKLLFIVLQHIISCVLAITPDSLLLSEAFFYLFLLIEHPKLELFYFSSGNNYKTHKT